MTAKSYIDLHPKLVSLIACAKGRNEAEQEILNVLTQEKADLVESLDNDIYQLVMSSVTNGDKLQTILKLLTPETLAKINSNENFKILVTFDVCDGGHLSRSMRIKEERANFFANNEPLTHLVFRAASTETSKESFNDVVEWLTPENTQLVKDNVRLRLLIERALGYGKKLIPMLNCITPRLATELTEDGFYEEAKRRLDKGERLSTILKKPPSSAVYLDEAEPLLQKTPALETSQAVRS